MVSVIVPVYNVEKYLKICIESILNQTYKEFELILIDDGSIDSSPKICDEYSLKDSRIKVIHQENRGLSSARNVGIRIASGSFIYFVDSDDCINPQLLEIVTAVAKKKNANIVQIGYESVPSDFAGPSLEDKISIDIVENKSSFFSTTECIYNLEKAKPGEEYRLNLATTVVWTKLYRKDAFESLLFPEGMRLHEDQMVAHRNYIQAKGMVFVDIPLYYYRNAEASLIREGWTPKRLVMMDYYSDRIEHVKTLEDPQLLKFVYNRFLIALIRHYNLADIKLCNEEKKKYKALIIDRFYKVYKECKDMFSFDEKIKFIIFKSFPYIFIRGLRVHDKHK